LAPKPGRQIHRDGRREFTAYMADLYRPGANEVALYEVERTRGRAVFHPLTD
jgi:hypothetical protein